LRGLILKDLSKPVAAVKAFARALDYWPDFSVAFHELIITFNALSYFERLGLIELMLDVVRQQPDRRWLYINLCQLALELNSPIHLHADKAFIRRSLHDLLDALKSRDLVLPVGTGMLDCWEEYYLLQIGRSDNMLIYLRMRNPSTGEIHIEAVHPSCRNCREALNWRVGGLQWWPMQIT